MGMTEGELKKHIIKCKPKDFDKYNATWRILENIYQKELLKIVDEAKQEFPDLDFVKPMQFVSEVNEKIEQFLNWKNKWFGDDNDEESTM